MRSFGFIVEKMGVFHETRVPDTRLSRANPPDALLLDEAVKSAFDLACLNGDLETAADLLEVLIRREARAAKDARTARPDGGTLLPRMRAELDRRHIMRGTRPPEGLWRTAPD